MNVDLNWCPCGKQSREDSMYCSDACYLKELASSSTNGTVSNRGLSRHGKNLGRDSFFSSNLSIHNYYNDKRSNLKVPEFKNPYVSQIFTASTNLAFKNRQKYQQSSYKNSKSPFIHANENLNSMASSHSSTGSTIENYFKKPSSLSSHVKIESSTKPKTVIITPERNENAKEKNEIKSSFSRSSYIIEAVYPVQNFNGKSSIAVY
ncbi:hypothetical protein H8356DRAFT_1625359 [Neocallimastix lanati (nom. inval.)]|jgi:hypothetical protein|uniref:Uncharacterized protein n=1 Tax=Neocallimastix californiae TaxID=1754190 RepID=A0A1Y2EUH5_9FUNG|nr:hypothetical protein H8356DRAFT_1625359 [Neocallimastix sp. JGI-2020a]ORY75210.1 hypothetical protein LY90DRAFT_137820 [Neocallimastix californiae]|eukprot:ORY75210.1 hypothetical protein LY90DRAFT_137820 [Neocallimastix californiae]